MFDLLIGKCIHQIDVDIGKVLLRRLDCRMRLPRIMNTPQRTQMPGIETLHADRQSIYAGVEVSGEPIRFDRAGIGLQRDLGIGKQCDAGANRSQQVVDCPCRQKGRGAATEKNRLHRPTPDIRQRRFQITDQRIDVLLFWQFAANFM